MKTSVTFQIRLSLIFSFNSLQKVTSDAFGLIIVINLLLHSLTCEYYFSFGEHLMFSPNILQTQSWNEKAKYIFDRRNFSNNLELQLEQEII